MAVNPLNMNGLATGIDTNSVVKSMLQNEQSRIDKALQSKQIITWKQELYREIIEQAKGLYQKYLSAASEKSLVLASKYSTYRINSTDVSVATATGGNKSINYELDVTSVASTAKKISNILSVSGNKATGSTTLSELGLVSDTSIYIKTNKGISESVTINQTDTISQLIDKINNIENIDIRANFSELTGRVSFETVETGESSKILISDELGNGINTLSFMGIDENEATGTNCNVSITTEDLQVINLNYETIQFNII